MENTIFKILHLTDLHFSASYAEDQDVILTALKDDLKKESNGPLSPDFLCFSGDIVFSGADEDSFNLAFEQILDIAKCADVSDDKIILVPGNHDANSDLVSREARWLKKIRDSVSESEDGRELERSGEFKSYAAEVFERFLDLAELFDGEGSSSYWPYCSVRTFDRISFISINTALLTGTGLPGLSDQGSLIVPEGALFKALKAVPEGHKVVFAGHHPLDWLAPKNKERISHLIEVHGDAYLFGHVHNAKPTKKTMSHGTIVTNQGGALYQGRNNKAWAGYAITSVCADEGSWLTKTKKWYEDRRVFDDATELGEDGQFTTNPSYWFKALARLDTPALEKWRSDILIPRVRTNCCDTLVGKDIDEVFVCPEFSFELPYAKESGHKFGSRTKILSYDDVIQSQDSFLISARPEMGKTSTLNRITLDLARKDVASADWLLPIRIDFGVIGHNRYSLQRCIDRALPSLPSHYSLKEQLEAGKIALLVDDLDFRDAKTRSNLFEFVDSYPNCRYIFFTSTPIFDNAGMHPEISTKHSFRTITMRPLKGSGLAELIEKSKPDKQVPSDQIRERLLREAELLNVPLTTVTSTFLIQILSSASVEKPMNQAALIGRYLDLLLEKYAAPELKLGTFNYKNKLDLLSAIAEYIVKEGGAHVPENKVTCFIADYLHMYGLAYSATSIFEHLVGAKVLHVKDGFVSFRLRMFLEYFIAYRMDNDDSFRNYVFDDNRYIQFPNEIALYCALNLKDDRQILRIFDNYHFIFDRVWKGMSPDAYGGEALDRFKLPSKDTSVDQLEEFSLATKTDAQIAKERHDTLEELELNDDYSQDVERYVPENDISAWLAHLILLGGMLKHLELIPNDTKKKVLDSVIDGWLCFTHYSLGMMAQLAQKRRLTINGITYKAAFPDEMSEGEVARLLLTAMPIAAARIASLTLATEKLGNQIREGIGSEAESGSKSLLKFSLLVDLLTDEIEKSGRSVLKRIEGSEFLSRAFALKLREIAVRYKLSESTLEDVRKLTADAAVNTIGGSKKEKDKTRNKIIEGIRRERLLVRIRAKDDI